MTRVRILLPKQSGDPGVRSACVRVDQRARWFGADMGSFAVFADEAEELDAVVGLQAVALDVGYLGIGPNAGQ